MMSAGDTTPARRNRPRPPASAGFADVRALDPHDLTNEDEALLVARGTAYVKEYAKVEEHPTILLKNLAVVLVELRKRCVDGEGRRDMGGRGYDYRQKAGKLYKDSGLGADRTSGIQQAVRWHIGNLLRDELTEEELAEYTLKPTKPLERQQTQRAENAVVLASARVTDLAVTSASAPVSVRATADQLTIGRAIHRQIEGLRTDIISSEMTDGQREALDAELAAAQQLITKLRRHTRKRSK